MMKNILNEMFKVGSDYYFPGEDLGIFSGDEDFVLFL